MTPDEVADTFAAMARTARELGSATDLKELRDAYSAQASAYLCEAQEWRRKALKTTHHANTAGRTATTTGPSDPWANLDLHRAVQIMRAELTQEQR